MVRASDLGRTGQCHCQQVLMSIQAHALSLVGIAGKLQQRVSASNGAAKISICNHAENQGRPI